MSPGLSDFMEECPKGCCTVWRSVSPGLSDFMEEGVPRAAVLYGGGCPQGSLIILKSLHDADVP